MAKDLKVKALPFLLDRSSPLSLSGQIADGIIRAIGCGYYGPGDRLPSLDQMAARLVVARQTIRVAVGTLVHRGVVVARRKIGILVLDPASKSFTAHVIHLRRCGPGYYFSTINARLTERLTGGRIRLSVIDLTPLKWRAAGAQVRAVFNGNRVDLAVIDGGSDELGKLCRSLAVPYLSVGNEPDPGATATLRIDDEKSLAALAARARKQGVRTVKVVGFCAEPTMNAFRRAGLETWLVEVSPKKRGDGLQTFEQAGYLAVKRMAAHPESLPDLLHFSDDYIARGGLMALAADGIKVPGQMRVSILSNRGYCPVFPVSLTRIENDPAAVGDSIADLVVELIKSGCRRHAAVTVSAGFVAGESL